MNSKKPITSCTFMSPCGLLYLGATDEGLCHLGWSPISGSTEGKTPILDKACLQLSEYFEGRRQQFDIPIHFLHGTDFQKRCWLALASIPYGTTISYGQEAQWIGNPKAVRAVGQANHVNPISIILPCHRVIGSNGSLIGYGGGLDKKIFLLELERKIFLSMNYHKSDANFP